MRIVKNIFSSGPNQRRVISHLAVWGLAFYFISARGLGIYAQEEPVQYPVNEESVEVPVEAPVEEKPANNVSLEGDQVEFIMSENKMVAEGNVKVTKEGVTLMSDRMEFYKDTNIAIAEGNVVLIREDGRFEGERLKFNFATMQGDFQDAKIAAKPFFGYGEKIEKVGENHLQLTRGKLTTCDLDKPHFNFYSKKVDVYPGDKVVARHVRMIVGNTPILYIPKFKQSLKDKRPVVTFTPGYDKDWGGFLLTQWRYHLNDNLKGIVHVDYREKKDLATGFDLNYNTSRYGEGIFRTYYMNERSITSKHFWQPRPTPTIERERFKAEWRHKWKIDEKTDAIWQFYKMKDRLFLKDYFEAEYDEDPDPTTYFLLTRGLTHGTFSYRTDVRVNRFLSAVERLPEIAYSLASTQMGETGFYWQNASKYSNLVSKTAGPSEIRQKTMRFDTENELSYPLKVSFIELRPFAGGEQTYYSRTMDSKEDNIIRGIFKTGADLSTKFYRIYEVVTNKYGLNITNLRHVITPSVAYLFTPDPTVPSSKLDQFDGIDSKSKGHSLKFAIENKLQTKRRGRNADLARTTIGSNFYLKESTSKGGFNDVTADIEITPLSWLRFYSDSTYDTLKERLQSSNFDLYINGSSDKWYLSVSKRYNVAVDDQIIPEMGYRFNKKWNFVTYQRFDLATGNHKEQEYSLQRDLHCWLASLHYNRTRDKGDEIWIIFTLKEFPEIGFNINNSFRQKKKPGSQASQN